MINQVCNTALKKLTFNFWYHKKLSLKDLHFSILFYPAQKKKVHWNFYVLILTLVSAVEEEHNPE